MNSHDIWNPIQAKARELARSELSFEEGYEEAREWLHDAATQDELDFAELREKPRTRPPEFKFSLNRLLHCTSHPWCAA